VVSELIKSALLMPCNAGTLSVCPLLSSEYDALMAAKRGNGTNVVYINGLA
jgi:hypothetical protein